MIRDIADYLTSQGKRLLAENPPNLAAAYHRLSSVHELYERIEKLENVSIRTELDGVYRLFETAEERLISQSHEDD